MSSKGNPIHGMYGTSTHKSWASMLRRCRGNNEKAKWYAARGIAVCERWKDLTNFVADMGLRPEGMTLERIDNDKGYEPGNCRWATQAEQARNKRTNVFIEWNGKRQCLAEWSREIGVSREGIRKRMRKGWPLDMVLSAHRYVELGGGWGHTHASRGPRANKRGVKDWKQSVGA